MRKISLIIVLALFVYMGASPEPNPGVVFEIEVTDHVQSPPNVETIETYVEGKLLKVEIASGGRGSKGDMIYRGDRREIVVVDHEDKSYMVMDEEAMQAIAGQFGSAMDEMKKALDKVPKDQREMVEKMMKERMPQAQAKRTPSTLRKTGDRATKNGYPCVKYEVLRDGHKTTELWVTDWDNIDGGDEAREAFGGMADFFKEMMEAMGEGGFGPQVGDENVFEHMKELGGFPVVTQEFGDDGSLEGESELRSARRRTLDPADFEPPAGYKRRSMGPQ